MAEELAPLKINVVSPRLVDAPAYIHMSADAKQAFFHQITASLASRLGRACSMLRHQGEPKPQNAGNPFLGAAAAGMVVRESLGAAPALARGAFLHFMLCQSRLEYLTRVACRLLRRPAR
jgi:hypothetical protein